MKQIVECALCGVVGKIETQFNDPPFVICEFCYRNLQPADSSDGNRFYVEG